MPGDKKANTSKDEQTALFKELCDSVYSSAMNFPGVISLDKDSADKALDILSRDIIAHKGIRIAKKDDALNIDVHIVVRYGAKIPQLSWELQKKIKKDISSINDIEINEINIHIEGVEKEDIKL